jgi:ABC-type sugar transport system ATPase subunit
VLDVVLRGVAFHHDRGFALRDVSLTATHSTHTALAGPPGCGISTILRLIGGTLRPQQGDVIFGQRRVNEIKAKHRPVLALDSTPDFPLRWSVEHALIAAVRARSLDRQDRHREFRLAAEAWELGALLERKVSSLSATEQTRVQLARVELLRPAILLADRIFERANPAARLSLADQFYRVMRVHGTTVLAAPSSRDELSFADQLVVIENGTVAQAGTPSHVYANPVSEAAARVTGEVNVLPVTVQGNDVDSVIGSWSIADPPFQGRGIVLARPSDFAVPAPGEDSEFVFSVEEAGFVDGRWLASGLLSGNLGLQVVLPLGTVVHKGRLLALRYEASRFRLLDRDPGPLQTRVPTDQVPPMRETG